MPHPTPEQLLDIGFDPATAAVLGDAGWFTPTHLAAIQAPVEPQSLAHRVALLSLRLDNSSSIRHLFAWVLAAHDDLLMSVTREVTGEPVSVLATASLMNGDNPLLYPYMPLAQIRAFGNIGDIGSYYHMAGKLPLGGGTPWIDQYFDDLAAVAGQMTTFEKSNKTVYGMIGLVTDGFDTGSSRFNIHQLADAIRGYRRMKTVVPFAMYLGPLPQAGSVEHMEECDFVRSAMVAADIAEPDGAEHLPLESLIRHLFGEAGFDPKMIFLPGQSTEKIMTVIRRVSKIMGTVSQGRMPAGLTTVH